jgi:tyrosinase
MDVRKDQRALDSTERADFISALLGLKKRPSLLHPDDSEANRYDDFVEVHLNAMNAMGMPGMGGMPSASWAHQTSSFGPWHRKFLRIFELELQSVKAGVTIPYWDWTVDQGKASSPWSSTFLGGDGRPGDNKVMDGPFAFVQGDWIIRVKDSPSDPDYLTRSMGTDTTAQNLPSIGQLASTLNATPYDTAPWEDSLRDQQDSNQWKGFRIRLEIVLHNLVHRWVAGAMATASSPNDPIFWLHHANIDRLWAQWQDKHTTEQRYLPSSDAPTGQNLNDNMIFHADDQPAPWPGGTTPAEMVDQHAVGYRYDTDPPTRIPGPPPVVHLVIEEPQVVADAELRRRDRQPLPMFVLESEIPGLK